MFSSLNHPASAGSRRRGLMAVSFGLAIVLAPALGADDGNAVAIVNGRAISREKLINTLIEAHGAEVLQQLIILEAAKHETQQRGIRVAQADVDTEFAMALNRIAESAGMTGEYATDKNKRDALQQVLDESRISMAEFMIGMERNAHLRKIAEKDVHITEETLREEFARTYGEKVVVRHIQIPRNDTPGLNQAIDLLGRGADFADVARRVSKNAKTAARGGEMEPFTFDDPDIPEALREMAFSLKPGAVSSPVLTGQFFHILKLERRIPPVDARFEDERAKVERRLRERVLPDLMGKLAVRLHQEAQLRVLDGKLRANYQEFLNRGALETVAP
jgi:parvulin-like peptidyl-prolyl isomerase